MSSAGQPAAPTPSASAAIQTLLGEVNSGKLPTALGGGANSQIINTLLGSDGGLLGDLAAQNAAGTSQIGLGNETTGLSNLFAQQTAGLSEQGNQLSAAGIANQQQLLALQQKLNPQAQSIEAQQYGLSTAGAQAQYALNPSLQQSEVSQYGLGQTSAEQSIANAATQQGAEATTYGLNYDTTNPNSQYNLSQASLANQVLQTQQQNTNALPQLSSNAAASGAGNSQGNQLASTQQQENYQNALTNEGIQGGQLSNQLQQAQTGQAAEVAGYNTQQQQAQEALQQSQLGQQSEAAQYGVSQKQAQEALQSSALGQKGEKEQYQYSQASLANQKKGLQIAQQQTGLSAKQIQTQLQQSIDQANLGSKINAAQILEGLAGSNAQATSQLLNDLGISGAVGTGTSKPTAKPKPGANK